MSIYDYGRKGIVHRDQIQISYLYWDGMTFFSILLSVDFAFQRFHQLVCPDEDLPQKLCPGQPFPATRTGLLMLTELDSHC